MSQSNTQSLKGWLDMVISPFEPEASEAVYQSDEPGGWISTR